MKMFAHVQELEVPRAEGLGRKEHTASAWSWRGKALMIEAGLQAPPLCAWSRSPWCFVPRRLPGLRTELLPLAPAQPLLQMPFSSERTFLTRPGRPIPLEYAPVHRQLAHCWETQSSLEMQLFQFWCCSFVNVYFKRNSTCSNLIPSLASNYL